MQQPTLGKTVKPAAEMAMGTSLLQGMAAERTTQHAWHWALKTEQPSFSQARPMQPKGKRQGAPGLRQHSALTQQTPACEGDECQSIDSLWYVLLPSVPSQPRTFPLQPKQSIVGMTDTLAQHTAQQRMSSSSSMASSPPHMVLFVKKQQHESSSRISRSNSKLECHGIAEEKHPDVSLESKFEGFWWLQRLQRLHLPQTVVVFHPEASSIIHGSPRPLVRPPWSQTGSAAD